MIKALSSVVLARANCFVLDVSNNVATCDGSWLGLLTVNRFTLVTESVITTRYKYYVSVFSQPLGYFLSAHPPRHLTA